MSNASPCPKFAIAVAALALASINSATGHSAWVSMFFGIVAGMHILDGLWLGWWRAYRREGQPS